MLEKEAREVIVYADKEVDFQSLYYLKLDSSEVLQYNKVDAILAT